MGMTVDEATLTPRQAERRQRVIRAALRLGAEGGYDAVQMRDVAAEAGVALGTIYRYFSSKDHLLAAAMAEWAAELQRRIRRTPPRGDSAGDRMVDVLRRAWRALERQPLLTAALIKALAASDEGVARSARQVTERIDEMAEGILDGIDPASRDGVVSIIRHVWYSALTTWANGRMDIAQVGGELERAARLLLACYEPGGDGSR